MRAPDRLQDARLPPCPSKSLAVVLLLVLKEIVFPLFRCNGKEALRADQIPRTILMIVPVNERRKELVVHTSAPPFRNF